MAKRLGAARPGFTMMELLIASGLSGLVLALAVGGLSQLSRLGSRQVSVATVRNEANEAVRELTALIRKASVVYYDPRPIGNNPGTGSAPANVSQAANLAAPAYRDGIPNQFLLSVPVPNPGTPARAKNLYRFSGTLYGGGFRPDTDLNIAPGLVAGVADVLGQRFQNPLMYWAEVQYATLNAAVGLSQNTAALIPQRWTFHVLYVAPMGIANQPNHPGLALPNRPKDLIPVGVNRVARSREPLELRLMTIPNVRADNWGNPLPQAIAAVATNANPYDRTARRVVDQRDVTRQRVLPPPFDFDRVRGFTANYDPIPVPYNGANLNGNQELFLPTYTGVQAVPPFNPFTSNASGNRTDPNSNNPAHTNFGDVGNDPPSQAALNNAQPPNPRFAPVAASDPRDSITITDRVLCRFIDPDAPLGTVVQLSNSVGLTHETSRRTPATAMGGGVGWNEAWYRRAYVPTHGPHCDFLANLNASRYNTSIPPRNPANSQGANGNLPQRALVSVSLRLRSRIDVPFESFTASQDVELDGVRLFQQAIAKSRQ